MSIDKPPHLPPLFIEVEEGDYLRAATVEYIEPDGDESTTVYDDEGNSHTVYAPVEGLKEMFRRHGYSFVSADEMKQAAKPVRAKGGPRP